MIEEKISTKAHMFSTNNKAVAEPAQPGSSAAVPTEAPDDLQVLLYHVSYICVILGR